MKSFIKKLTPNWLLGLYHYILSISASLYYRFPSKKMVIIGVTGTKGKTSVANFIWSVLEAGGYKTGITTTSNIRIGKKEIINDRHMTMPGRFYIQKYLSEMVSAGCKFAVVETTSEGIKQHRHVGIEFDFLVFTNLSPEHLPSHGGSYEKYKCTKGIIFRNLLRFKHKIFDCKQVEKMIIANNDDDEKNYFLSFPADRKLTFGLTSSSSIFATNIVSKGVSSTFSIGNSSFSIPFPGLFNIYNALPAILIGQYLEIANEKISRGLSSLPNIPGRMESIDNDQRIKIFVDYAHEGVGMKAVLETCREIAKNKKVIVLLGAEGGGRDKSKRPLMGEICAKLADFVIVSNVDPYNDDPIEIIEDIAKASERAGKVREKNLFTIESRKKAISKALSLAQSGDVVIVTGKGAEQSMIINGKHYPWDDRRVVKEELAKLKVIRNNPGLL